MALSDKAHLCSWASNACMQPLLEGDAGPATAAAAHAAAAVSSLRNSSSTSSSNNSNISGSGSYGSSNNSSSSNNNNNSTSSSSSSSKYQQQLQHEHDQFAAVAAEWWNPHGPMGVLHAYTPVRVSFLQHVLQTLPLYRDILRQQQQQQQQQQGQQQQQQQEVLPLQGVRIVDVGCGGGLLTEALAAAGATVKGVDANSELLAVARLRQQQRDPGAAVAAVQLLLLQLLLLLLLCVFREERGVAHVVILSELIEHLWGPDAKGAAIAAAAARLQQGGLLLLTTPNRTPENYVAAILLAEYILGLVPKVRLS
ncbi:hypothetical protein Emed_000272 [Eimeria media]